MGPKKNRSAGDKPKAADEDTEEALQAVILADPFETRFTPFTLERPRALLPLANVPLIEYTFEFLANAGVEEVFVYCGAHTDQLEEYINQSTWASPSSPFSKLEIIRSTSASIGDAMRDLDARDLLTGDFILVYGDVISNLPLEDALKAHRARRAADKNAIMTMVLREAGANHRTKAQGTRPLFVIDPSKNRCLHFEQMPNQDKTNFLSIDPILLSDHQEIEVRQDLIDCGIDICTPDVLALWSDNWDFQAPRKGFLHSVLKDYELNGKTIHTHVVKDHYAARVRNLHAYDSVSKDVVSRWAYPLCPDSNLLRGQSYRLQKGNIYKEEGVVLTRSCIINHRSVIGRGTSIGEGSVISNTIIGRGCSIGRNVTIDGAYIWDNAVIQDGAVIQQAIIAGEAVIGRKCKIEAGALISYGVKVADGITIEGSRRLTRAKRKREDGEQIETGESDITIVGESGDGFDFVDPEEEDEEEIVDGLAGINLVYNNDKFALSTESISTLNSESDFSDGSVRHLSRSEAGSFISVASSDHAANFDHDAATSIYESLVDGHESANIQLELTSLRMSTNASEHQVRRAVVVAFMKRISQVQNSGLSVKQAVNEVLTPHKELLSRIMFDKDKSAKTDQVDFMLLLQAELMHREQGDSILLFTSMELYNLEVIEAEGFEQWWEDAKSSEEGDMKKVRAKTQQFIDFLAEDDESEEDDDDEEEDDDDDE